MRATKLFLVLLLIGLLGACGFKLRGSAVAISCGMGVCRWCECSCRDGHLA